MEDQTKPTLTLNPDEEKKTDILQGTMPVRQAVHPVAEAQSEYSADPLMKVCLVTMRKKWLHSLQMRLILLMQSR